MGPTGCDRVADQLAQVAQGAAITRRIQDTLDRYGVPLDVQAR